MKIKDAKIVLVLILAMIFLAGCKGKTNNEKQIMRDVPKEILSVCIDDTKYSMNLDSLKIVKRKTEDREDEVYCNIVMSNKYYKVEGEYYCCYNYYDKGGWILESSYLSNVNISILFEELPNVIQNQINKEDISYNGLFYDVQDVSYEKVDNAEYSIKYDIKRKRLFCTESGSYIVNYSLVNHGGTVFSWEMEEGQIDLNTTWDIVGTFVGDDDFCSCELVIDSFNQETYEAHIASFRYESAKKYWFMGTKEEASDVTATAEILEPSLSGHEKCLRLQFYKKSNGSYNGTWLTVYPDKATYAGSFLFKID